MAHAPGFIESSAPPMHAANGTKEEWNYVTLRSATACTYVHILSFGSWLEPRYIFAAG